MKFKGYALGIVSSISYWRISALFKRKIFNKQKRSAILSYYSRNLLVSVLLFDEKFTLNLFIGITLILLGAILNVLADGKKLNHS